MARRRHWLLTVLALAASAWAVPASGNGGGYAYGVKSTGNVAPFQASGTERVRIDEESLEVVLRSTDAAVTVRYTMRNVSGEPARVRFGFPVEAVRENDFEDEEGPARPKGLAGAIQQLKGYTVVADGQSVPARFELEPFAAGKIAPFPGSRALAGIAGWMVACRTDKLPIASDKGRSVNWAARHLLSERAPVNDFGLRRGSALR